MVISDSTISQNVWSDVRSALVAASITTSVGSTVLNANITSQYSDKAVDKPQIVIVPPMVSEGDFNFGGTQGKKIINVVVECYSNKSLGVDQLCDAVCVVFRNNSIDGISLVSLDTDYAFNSPGENKFHLKTVTAAYVRE